jgi:hypothetical protein
MSKVVSAFRNKPTFDPNTAYKWEPDDVFEISGNQLAALFHPLHKEINDIGGVSIAAKYEAYAAIMEVLRRGVEQGVIVPQPSPEVEYIQETS